MIRIAFLACMVAGCGGGSGSSCTSTEIEVHYFGGSADGKVACMPIPSACNGMASCAVTPCISAMYSTCASPYFGVACSDTFPPTIVSCNQ
jgi:hypothetical protein